MVKLLIVMLKTTLVKGWRQDSGSLVSLTSGGLDSLLQSSNDVLETEVTTDLSESQTSGSTNPDVKGEENHASGSANPGVKEVDWSVFGVDPAVMGQHSFGYNATTEQAAGGEDQNSSQYWENLYPGWKFDVNTGQWYQIWFLILNTPVGTMIPLPWNGALWTHIISSTQSTVQGESQLNQNGLMSPEDFSHNDDQNIYGAYKQIDNNRSIGSGIGGHDYNWSGSLGKYNQQNSNMWQTENVAKNEPVPRNI
ncbi:hypothetical protein HAX54_018882 [Datura stramonium]|uniref:Uncharacterized protein n=1 Tax=Datura stramonium TaxID=4076 RepID=A0ABS8RJF8_DATST|nr:hypothetical protein [Datura stramonium]